MVYEAITQYSMFLGTIAIDHHTFYLQLLHDLEKYAITPLPNPETGKYFPVGFEICGESNGYFDGSIIYYNTEASNYPEIRNEILSLTCPLPAYRRKINIHFSDFFEKLLKRFHLVASIADFKNRDYNFLE